jgi:hypothetical protein
MTRKELLRLMPANGEDMQAAKRILELGHPAIVPILRDLVDLMRVADSPMADAFAEFFGRLGRPGLQEIQKGLEKDNCWLRHRIFKLVLPAWPSDVVRELTSILTLIATHPDAYDNDLRSLALLKKYNLADAAWLSGWIEFKKERIADRNRLMRQLEEGTKNVQ